MRQKTHQPLVVDVVKESFDVGLYQPLCAVVRDNLTQSRQRLMCVALGAKTVRTITKLRFPDRLQDPGKAMLDDPILKTGYTQRSALSVALGDIGPPGRLRSVAQATQSG